MKKFYVMIMTVISAFILACFAGCKPQDSSSTPPAKPYAISETEIEIGLYEEYALKAYTDSTKTTEIEAVWSVDGYTVSVDETGKVKALSVGESTVKATIEETVLHCKVTVKAPSLVAELKFPNQTISMKVADEQSVTPVLVYQSALEELPADIVYTSSDSTLLAVEKNADGSCKMTAKGVEENVVVTATCHWNGYPMSCSMRVEIQPNVDIFLNETAVTINTHVLNAENTQKQITVKSVYNNGTLVENPEITWGIDDENVATMEDGLITGRKAGNTQAWAAWTDGDGEEHKTYIGVYVQLSKATPQSAFELYLNPNDGENVLSFADEGVTFNTDDVVVAYDVTDESNPQELEVEVYNGGVKFNTLPSFGEKIISVEKQGYYQLQCTTHVYSLVIDTPEELLNWQSYTEKDAEVKQEKNTTSAKFIRKSDNQAVSVTRYNYSWNYDGYVVLGANITLYGGENTTDTFVDLDNSDIVCTEGFRAGGADYGFKGVFDGRGYTISGGVYGTSGLFGGIHSTGVVRNLAIVNAKVAAITFAGEKFNEGTVGQDGVGKGGRFNTDVTRAWGASTVIADQVNGTMENCLVIATRIRNFIQDNVTSSYGAGLTQTYVDATDPENPVTYTGCFGYSTPSVVGFNNYATIKNCVFAADKSQGARIFNSVNATASYENVFIFANNVAPSNSNNQTEGYTHTAICTTSATQNETAKVSAEMVAALTADVWDLTEGQAPKFKTK